tara:strand:+ start:376 stop:513 length:138 start_codon:yes stop_codon:yes gene_type:complete
MKDLLIVILVVSLAVWWAVKNPQTADKLVTHIEKVVSTAIDAVSD